jgi:hypothetical protein
MIFERGNSAVGNVSGLFINGVAVIACDLFYELRSPLPVEQGIQAGTAPDTYATKCVPQGRPKLFERGRLNLAQDYVSVQQPLFDNHCPFLVIPSEAERLSELSSGN